MFTYPDLHHQRALAGKLLLIAIAAVPSAYAQLGLGLTPMRLEFPAAGGKAYSGSLTLTNSATESVRVRTEILDFYVDNNQTPQFLPNVAAESPYSCREWITVNPMETEIAPRTQIQVRYTVRVPATAAEQSYHCAVGFVSLPPLNESAGVEVRTAVRVVTTLYPIVGHPAVKGSIAGMTLEPVKAGPNIQWRGVVVLENAGQMLYRPKGRLEVVDAAGSVVETSSLVAFPVLPHRRQRFLLPLKTNLAAGSYTLRSSIDFGSEVQEASTKVVAERQTP